MCYLLSCRPNTEFLYVRLRWLSTQVFSFFEKIWERAWPSRTTEKEKGGNIIMLPAIWKLVFLTRYLPATSSTDLVQYNCKEPIRRRSKSKDAQRQNITGEKRTESPQKPIDFRFWNWIIQEKAHTITNSPFCLSGWNVARMFQTNKFLTKYNRKNWNTKKTRFRFW